MSAPDARARLRAVLDALLRKLTRRTWANARQMQMDVGAAIGLLRDADVPNSEFLASRLGALLRELGRPRPDLSRYVLHIEEAIGALDRPDEGNDETAGSGGAPADDRAG